MKDQRQEGFCSSVSIGQILGLNSILFPFSVILARLPVNLMDALHVLCNTRAFAMESGCRQQSEPAPEGALTPLLCHQRDKGCHQGTINTGEGKHLKITHHPLNNIQKFSKLELRQHNCCSPSVQGMVLPVGTRSIILHKFMSCY